MRFWSGVLPNAAQPPVSPATLPGGQSTLPQTLRWSGDRWSYRGRISGY